MRILVVDDRFDSRWGITDWLVAFFEPVAVESAASAAEALQAIEQRKPDVVLATHPLPDLDAIELAQHLKSRPEAPVVVVMTDRSDSRFERACAAAGVDFWLEKRHLQARLLTFLQQRFSLNLTKTRFS